MLTEHDQNVLLRCRRLGHETAFGYCRQESRGKPCRLILDCWWERFDVRTFLRAHLSPELMEDVERTAAAPPPSKLLGLLDLIQQTKTQLATEGEDAGNPPQSKASASRPVLKC